MEVEREWWTNSLVTDIHNTLRRKEMELLSIPYLAQSPQLHMRRYLVDWIAVISENFSLSAPTRHLAIYLLDYTMDRFDIEEKVIYLVAIVCLLVAGEFMLFSKTVYTRSIEVEFRGYFIKEFLTLRSIAKCKIVHELV